MNIRQYATIIASIGMLSATGQTISEKRYITPLDIPLSLSANFGELRSNHFHGGLDFKTQGVVGKPIHCAADGYVSRVLISAGGYGQALFITHSDGYTSVYGHVKSFAPAIEKVVTEYQMKHETFSADLKFEPNLLKFKAGDIIALSGNEGYSFGPHLHFEIRNTQGNMYVNPLSFFKDKISDTKPPLATLIAIYPQKGEGEVDGSQNKKRVPVASLANRIEAWGKIGLGIKAYDYMNGTANHYGVYQIKLFMDDKEIYKSVMDDVLVDGNRMINAYVDYDELKRNGSWIMRSFATPGNSLRFLNTEHSRGIVDINQERDYNFRYELEDLYGNKKVYRFTIKGCKHSIEPYIPKGKVLKWNKSNVLQEAGMELVIPKGMLYDDVELNFMVKKDSVAVSNIYQINDMPVPLHSYCSLMIGVKRKPIKDSTKYYIASVAGNRKSYVGGKYENGWVKADIRELGSYTVAVDTIAPTITPLQKNRWKFGDIEFRVSDAQTGIKSHKVYIDDKFQIFGYSLKNGKITMKYPSQLIKGKVHKMEIAVEDNCGNIKRETYTF